MASDGSLRGNNPCVQNMAQLLQHRRSGTIPASLGGRVSGGHTSARSISAGARGWGFRDVSGGSGGGLPLGSSSFGFRRSVGEHPSIIERLRHTATLRGHAQCVNRLCWNDTGTAIASGSDDTTVCLFDAATTKRKLQFETGHTRNILGVRILPSTNDQVIVTGAMDREVRLHKAPFTSEELTETFDCHQGRVNAVEVEPGNPYLFWSASEDGTVRQFDRRLANAGCSSTGHADDAPGIRRLSRNAGNCIVALTSEGSAGGAGGRRAGAGAGAIEAVEAIFDGLGGRLSASSRASGRAMHVACNPCNSNYLAVACGDLFARVFDRRTLSLGKASDLRSSDAHRRVPVLSVCPTHDHPKAGGAFGSGSSGGPRARSLAGIMNSSFGTEHHSTCVAFSPDGRNLLVSYHRDHVYLFDATGARRSSATVSDPAISSYFMPCAPPPPQQLPSGTSSDDNPQKGVSKVTERRFEGGKGSAREPATFVRSRRGLPRRSSRLQDDDDRREDVTRELLVAHRALSSWDGRGEPPVTRSRLVELYRRRSSYLRIRRWRGDRYMSLLDAARAKELAPSEAQPRWEYVEALSHAGRRSAARAEAARCLAEVPELRPRAEAYLTKGRPSTVGRRQPARHTMSFRGSDGEGGVFRGVAGVAAGRRGEEEAAPEELEEEGDDDEEEDYDEEEDSDEEGGEVGEGLRTPPRWSRHTAGAWRGSDGGGGGSGSGDQRYKHTSRSRSTIDYIDADVCLSEEISRAREWHRSLSRTGDVGEDPRCPGDTKRGDCDDKDASETRNALKKVSREEEATVSREEEARDWTERLSGSGQIPRDALESCPRAMIQWYAGACNLQTVIKEACFLGERGGYVAAGSDDGRMFIWESESGRLVRAIEADTNIVNCIAPHPSLPLVATSGLENVVRLWSPLEAKKEDVNGEGGAEGYEPGSDVPRLGEISLANQSSMDASGLVFPLQPLMHQLVVQITAAARGGGGEDQDDDDRGGPGECIQA